MASSVHWFWHVFRKEDGHIFTTTLEFSIQVQTSTVGTTRTWNGHMADDYMKVDWSRIALPS